MGRGGAVEGLVRVACAAERQLSASIAMGHIADRHDIDAHESAVTDSRNLGGVTGDVYDYARGRCTRA